MKATEKKYRLYKGFSMIGEFDSIREAKSHTKEDGTYCLRSENYKGSWIISNGVIITRYRESI